MELDLGRIDSPFPDDNHPIESGHFQRWYGQSSRTRSPIDRIRLQITEFSNMQHEYVEILRIRGI